MLNPPLATKSYFKQLLLTLIAALGFVSQGCMAGDIDSDDDYDVDPLTLDLAVAPGDVAITASADTRAMQQYPATNFGVKPTFGSDAQPGIWAYLRFDVQEGATINSAKIKLYVTNRSNNGPKVFLTSNSWDERTLTWNNKPAPQGAALADVAVAESAGWLEIDVSSAVRGAGTYSFVLVPDSSDLISIASREQANGKPHLILSQSGAASVCVPTTCAAQGKNCGTISDGCGGNLACGTCTSPATCGGAGVANVCGTAGTTTPPPPPPPPPASSSTGIWISRDEILRLPTTGAAWDNVKRSCDAISSDPGLLAQVGGNSSNHDVQTLACAYVAVRLNNGTYYQKTVNNLIAAVGSETRCGGDSSCHSLSLHRNLASYAIAADVIGFPQLGLTAYGKNEAYFRDWLRRMMTYDHPAGDGCSGSNCDVISKHEQMMNNHGSVAGASRVAIDLYVGDMTDFARAARVFKGYVGDRASWVFTRAVGELSWQADPNNPVPINPAGARKTYNGTSYSIDGAMGSEMQRGGMFQFPPVHTGYPWAAMYGIILQAEILHRKGYDTYNWSNQAIRRSAQFVYDLDRAYGGWWNYWTGVNNMHWVINKRYGTGFPAQSPTGLASNIMGTDWTHR